jgi:cellulose synthase operon protein C
MIHGVNLRFFCYSVACFGFLAVVVYFVHNWQVQRESGILLAKAEEAETSGDAAKAIVDYSKYLLLEPKDVEAQARYGSLLADVHLFSGANQALEAVLRREPANSAVRRKAAKVDMAIDRVQDARIHLEKLLAESPDDAELLDLLGQCLAVSGDYLKAGSKFEMAIERDPSRVAAYVHLIAIYSRPREELDKDKTTWIARMPKEQQTALQQDKAWAEKIGDYWSDRMVDANPKDPKVFVLRGERRYRKQLWDGALQDAEAALKLKPDDPPALHLAARSCLAATNLDKAAKFAKHGVDAAPKDPAMYEIQADVELAQRQPEDALKSLQKAVDVNGSPQAWWRLGILQLAMGKIAAAQQTAAGLRTKVLPRGSQVDPDLYADLLEAKIKQTKGNWLEASQQFGKAGLGLKSFPNLAREAFYGQGECCDQLADLQDALKAYRQAVDADPMWSPAREKVAATLQSLGRTDEALEEQHTVVSLKNAPLAAWVTLIRWSILKTSRLNAENRDWRATEDLVNQFARLAPDSAVPKLMRAELLIAQNRGTEAEKILDAERNRNPKEIDFWKALVDAAIYNNHLEQARKILEEAEQKFGDRVSLRLSRANYLVRKGEKVAKEQVGKLAEKSKDFSPQDQAQLWRNLVPIALALDDLSLAERISQLLMADSPDDLRVREELFDVAAQSKDVKLMDAALDEIHRLEGAGATWNYATALRLVFGLDLAKVTPAGVAEKAEPPDTEKHDTNKRHQAVLQEALGHLTEALRVRPNWPQALLLQGVVYEGLQQDEIALARYREAIRLSDNNPEAARRAFQLLYRKGEYAAANEVLHQLERQQVPFSTELFRDQSRVLGGLQDYAGALKAAQRAALNSNDYRDYLWLGQVLRILGRREEAEKALLEANSLNEKAPETWVALVEFYIRADQKDRAEKTLAKGQEKNFAAGAPLALAECLEMLGKTAEARQQYDLALKQKPDDLGVVRSVANYYAGQGAAPKAAEQLLRIINGQVRSSPQQVDEARRSLALLRFSQGGYPNLLEAIRLVDENLSAAPASIDNLRLKALLLSQHPQLSKRSEGLAIYEKLAADPHNFAAEDRYRLAQLYLAAGDWTKARPQLLTLATQGNQPQYLAAFVQRLLEHREYGDAQQWIDHLEEVAPGNMVTVELRAALQFRLDKADEAIATLTNFLEKVPAGSADRSLTMLKAANELEVLASLSSAADSAGAAAALKKAEELYRKAVHEDPRQGLVLVRFLARQKRFDEALALAADVCPTAEPPQIAAIAELLAAQSEISAAQLERLGVILAAARKKHDKAMPLLLAQAELSEKREKIPEAEASYREVLQLDGQFVGALNNLAGLLALSGRHLDEAKDMIDKAIVLAGPAPNLLDTRASVYLALGQADKAVADMQEVLAEQPAANRYFHLALAQQKLGRKAEAMDALVKARTLQIRPEILHPLERPAYAEFVRTMQ